MARSKNAIFVKDNPEPEKRKSFCQFCEEKYSKLNKLVPRILDDGTIDDKFKRCSYCGELTPIYEVKFETEYEPRGYLQSDPYNPFNQSGTKVSVIRNKRTIRKSPKGQIEPLDVPKFGNKDDVELERLIHERSGVINYIHDVVVESSDSEGI